MFIPVHPEPDISFTLISAYEEEQERLSQEREIDDLRHEQLIADAHERSMN